MTATMPPPSAPPSLDNPLTMGQFLWRISFAQRGMHVEPAKVMDIKGHYAELRPSLSRRNVWIDARDINNGWYRSEPNAALQLASLYPAGTAPWLANRLWSIGATGQRLRPAGWNALLKEATGREYHPKTVCCAFRWLRAHGMALRTGSRKGRWQIVFPDNSATNSETP